MKKALLFVAAALALVAKPALAADGAPYVGANLGLSIFSDSDVKIPGLATQKVAYKSSFAFGLEVGYRLNENIRLEADFSYKKSDVDTVGGVAQSGTNTVAAYGFMANGYYDITQAKLPVTPFIGAGIGLVYGKISTSTSEADGGLGDKSSTQFGYQLTVGLAYAINPQATIFGLYRYQGSSDFSFTVQSTKVTATYGSHNILAGLNYSF